MTSVKPSLELLRQLSDELVLTALIEQRRQTKSELAGRTGVSKPTVAESITRLEAAGVVVDTGERTSGPGRSGTYYGISPEVGVGLAVAIAPDGIVAEAVDVFGTVLARSVATVARPARPRDVISPLRQVCRRASKDAGVGVRLTVVSAADPVERGSGRLVHLPDAPFLVGELSPIDVLAGVVDGPVHVDNDVNWAARAEQAAAARGTLVDAAYLHLGAGLGGAVISDCDVRRGHRGLAGEIMHVITVGPNGQACPFIRVFAQLGLQDPDSPAIDLAAIDRVLAGRTARDRKNRHIIARAVAGVCAAVTGLVDPEVIVLGGAWGTHPALLEAVTAEVAALPRPVEVRPASVATEPSLHGARLDACRRLRRAMTQYRTDLPPPKPFRVSNCPS